MKIVISYIVVFILLVSCAEEIAKKDFAASLVEPCMLLNIEQDNTIEGSYLSVKEIVLGDSCLIIDLPKDFFITTTNCSNWMIGWGNNVPLFDGGVENLYAIKSIDNVSGKIYLGSLLRGSGLPIEKQRVVFWNINPSGFKNLNNKPIINAALWPQFSGKSISFSSVVYDSLMSKWVMIVNECDTSRIQIYEAVSTNLINWEASNQGRPILKPEDFKACSWAGFDKTGKFKQTPFVSDIIGFNGKWYVFLDGYSADGKRHIGLAVAEKSLAGPFKVFEEPILSPGVSGSWNDEAVFYAKVKKYKKGFVLLYDGRNRNGEESVGMATSTDLLKWDNVNYNPIISQHTGWRSAKGCTEPNYVEVRNDSIFVLIAGYKMAKAGAWHHYVTKRMYMDVSGNVEDAQLGMYCSTDGGKTFIAHKNNPVFVNDYSNRYENEHMGGNFKLIQTDTADFIIYQAKSSFEQWKYNILVRVKHKSM